MVGLNKFEGKARRQERRVRKGVPVDLAIRYRTRTKERKRVENEDGSYYFDDDYEGDE